MAEYKDRPSSREKDLVDLVVLAITQDIDGNALRVAITTEARRRGMEPLERFAVPSTWGAGYAKLSKAVRHCSDYRSVELATQLVARLVDPALTGGADGRTWFHESREWS